MFDIEHCPKRAAHQHSRKELRAFRRMCRRARFEYAEEFLAVHQSPDARRALTRQYGVPVRRRCLEDFCVHIDLLTHTRDDESGFLTQAEDFVLNWYDYDEFLAAEHLGITPEELQTRHWGDDPATVKAGRRLLAHLRTGAAAAEQYQTAHDRWGTTWKDLTTFRANPVPAPPLDA